MWKTVDENTPNNVYLHTCIKTKDGIIQRKMILKKINNKWYTRFKILEITPPTHYIPIKHDKLYKRKNYKV